MSEFLAGKQARQVGRRVDEGGPTLILCCKLSDSSKAVSSILSCFNINIHQLQGEEECGKMVMLTSDMG